jgi:hypothetical protein
MNQSLKNLLGLLRELKVVDIVGKYYGEFGNEAPPKLLEREIGWVTHELENNPKEPNPNNDKAMSELHKFVEDWSARNNLQGARELHYLGLYLSGRLEVQVNLQNLKKDLNDLE